MMPTLESNVTKSKRLALAALFFTGAGAAGAAFLGGGYELRLVPSSGAQAAIAPSASPAPESAAPVAAPPNVFVSISDRMIPSVVNIFTTKAVRARPRAMDPWGELFGFPGIPPEAEAGPGPGPQQGAQAPSSLGTGFVIETEKGGGLILTNHHVIAGADGVQVKFTEAADEAEIPAEVVGADPELDIALLRVKTDRKLMPVALGDSEKLKVGEWIAAVGNPFGHGHSVTHGIVSAKERTLPGGFGRYLQVDAPINPGNSGGPLVNMAGEVVGINNAIDARGPGIGFAIPVNSVKELLPQLKSRGHVERGYLGVHVMPLRPELAKALRTDAPAGTPVVSNVAPGTPAAKAGLEPYDIIARIDGAPVKSTEHLIETVLKVPVGRKVSTEVIRGGKTLRLDLTVAPRPQKGA